MPLAPPTRLSPYEIVAPLGAGGTGEVFRAQDTRLSLAVTVEVGFDRHIAKPADPDSLLVAIAETRVGK